jgi:transposase
MSGSELQRIEVLSEVLARKRTELSAAAVLGLSTRQTRRLVRAYRDGGGGALINKARGRSSNNQLIVGVREFVVELVRTRYADFGPTLAAEVLFEKDGVKVSRETLRKWMIEDGLWLSRRQRRSFHQPRLRVRGTANWSRSTAVIIAGSSSVAPPVHCWSSSTMQPVG